jgi:hypothetical protein
MESSTAGQPTSPRSRAGRARRHRVPRVVRAFLRRTNASTPPRWTTCVVDPPPLSPSPAPRLGAPPRPGRGPCRPRAASCRAAASTRACRASTWPSCPGLTPPRLALVPVVLRARQKCPGSHSVSCHQYCRRSPLADAAAESCFPRRTTAAQPAPPLALTSLHLSPSSLPLIAALNAGPPAARGQVAARRRGRLAGEGTSRSSPLEEAGKSPLGLRLPTRRGSAPHHRPAASSAPAGAHCEDGKRSKEIFVKPGTFT